MGIIFTQCCSYSAITQKPQHMQVLGFCGLINLYHKYYESMKLICESLYLLVQVVERHVVVVRKLTRSSQTTARQHN